MIDGSRTESLNIFLAIHTASSHAGTSGCSWIRGRGGVDVGMIWCGGNKWMKNLKEAKMHLTFVKRLHFLNLFLNECRLSYIMFIQLRNAICDEWCSLFVCSPAALSKYVGLHFKVKKLLKWKHSNFSSRGRRNVFFSPCFFSFLFVYTFFLMKRAEKSFWDDESPCILRRPTFLLQYPRETTDEALYIQYIVVPPASSATVWQNPGPNISFRSLKNRK